MNLGKKSRKILLLDWSHDLLDDTVKPFLFKQYDQAVLSRYVTRKQLPKFLLTCPPLICTFLWTKLACVHAPVAKWWWVKGNGKQDCGITVWLVKMRACSCKASQISSKRGIEQNPNMASTLHAVAMSVLVCIKMAFELWDSGWMDIVWSIIWQLNRRAWQLYIVVSRSPCLLAQRRSQRTYRIQASKIICKPFLSTGSNTQHHRRSTKQFLDLFKGSKGLGVRSTKTSHLTDLGEIVLQKQS